MHALFHVYRTNENARKGHPILKILVFYPCPIHDANEKPIDSPGRPGKNRGPCNVVCGVKPVYSSSDWLTIPSGKASRLHQTMSTGGPPNVR